MGFIHQHHWRGLTLYHFLSTHRISQIWLTCSNSRTWNAPSSIPESLVSIPQGLRGNHPIVSSSWWYIYIPQKLHFNQLDRGTIFFVFSPFGGELLHPLDPRPAGFLPLRLGRISEGIKWIKAFRAFFRIQQGVKHPFILLGINGLV